MSTSENSKGNKTYNVHLSQQKIKDLNKDFITLINFKKNYLFYQKN